MRTARQLPANIPKDLSPQFPDGTVYNDTLTQVGTPVLRELLGDLLTNFYHLLSEAGIEPNGQEDSDDNGYQIVDALKKLTNDLNDVEQQLVLTGNTFAASIDLDSLPVKYFFLAVATGDYVNGKSYALKGSGDLPAVTFNCATGFKTGDEVLIILDAGSARAILIAGQVDNSTVNASFGIPVAFNDSTQLWYQSQGVIFSDLLISFDLQNRIRVFEGDASVLVYEVFIIAGYAVCVTLRPDNGTYKLYRFSLDNMAANPVNIAVSNPALPVNSADNQPFFFTDGANLFVTNNAGASAGQQIIKIYALNVAGGQAVGSTTVNLDNGFIKSTNTIINGGYLYSYVGGEIMQYNLQTGAFTQGPSFPSIIGIIFKLNGSVYYLSSGTAKKWVLPVY